ncbi:MAG: DUF6382 domain-containing protein [Velocimicrobium sp.]
MIVEYKRDLYRNYLVVRQEEKEQNGYESKMIQNNRIVGLLPVQQKRIDANNFYYYDISSLHPCSEIYQKAKLSKEEIIQLMEGIIVAIEKGKEFLLKEDNFVLEPSYLYINPSNYKVSLCYVPGYAKEIVSQFSVLLEFILDRVDYQKEQAVFLAYGLYKKNKDKTSTLSELKKSLKEEPCFRKEEKEVPIEKPLEEQIKEESFPIKEEEEVVSYRISSIVLCGGAALFGLGVSVLLFRAGIFLNAMSGQFEITKFALFLVILAIAEYGLFRFFLSDKNKITKIKQEKPKKVSKREEHLLSKDLVYQYDRVETFDSEEENTILLLNESPILQDSTYCLSPCNQDNNQKIVISEFPFLIGKQKPNVDYEINHESISRFHAKIEREEKLFFLTDMNSTNGTYVNGNRLESNKKLKIENGDEIAFAQMFFIFNKV